MPVRTPSLAALRRACTGMTTDGTVRLLFVRDGGRVGLVQSPLESVHDADQFLARYLEGMITDVAAPGVVVAVCRHDGRPTYADRQLWAMLSARLAASSTTLLDLVAAGSSQVWSARKGRPLNPPRRRRPSAGRRSASRASAR